MSPRRSRSGAGSPGRHADPRERLGGLTGPKGAGMTATTQDQAGRPLGRSCGLLDTPPGVYRLTGGRLGLQQPERGAKFGMLRLHTVGRRSGQLARRDRRLLRGRPEPRHPRDERLGQGRAGLVAQPPGEPGGDGRARRTAAAKSRLGPPPAPSATACGRRSDEYPGWGADLGGLAAQRPAETAIVVFEPKAGRDR